MEKVILPKHLEKHPFLQEFYGTVEWSVRAIFEHYMGWFSGEEESRATNAAALRNGCLGMLKISQTTDYRSLTGSSNIVLDTLRKATLKSENTVHSSQAMQSISTP